MASIFDEYKLTIEKLEAAIGHGLTHQQILTAFRVSGKEMDDFCKKNYNGCNFAYVYNAVRQMALDSFFETCQALGYRGNVSALNIINTAIQRLGQDQTVRIVFDNNLPKEDEEDKLNDEEECNTGDM